MQVSKYLLLLKSNKNQLIKYILIIMYGTFRIKKKETIIKFKENANFIL